MDLVVDNTIYLFQEYGGITRIFSEILPRMCSAEENLRVYSLMYSKSNPDNLPRHERIVYQSTPELAHYLRPYRFWKKHYHFVRHITGRFISGNGSRKIWLSTYYTTPLLWLGRKVVVAYDFIHEKFRDVYWQNDLSSVDATIARKSRAISKADLVICISETTRRDLLNLYHVPIRRTAVIHLAQSPVFGALDTPGTPAKEFILFVGKRNRYKGFDTLLQAFSKWERNHQFVLICAGGGDWTHDEEQLLIELGLVNNVILLPSVGDEKLCELYNQATMFVHPSHYEGFGIPLLEAMACGCPIVASQIPSTIEVAENIPIYFPPGNIYELILAFDLAVEEGKNSRRVDLGRDYSRNFSWDKTAQSFLSVLATL